MTTRQAVYRGLLSAIGRYFYHYAHDGEYNETVEFDDAEPFRPIIDWVMDGREPVVHAFHVWGVGNGDIGGHFAYDYCKDREITWTGEEWEVEESAKYVINGEENAPVNLPTRPRWSA